MSFLQRTKDFRLDRLVESYMEDLPMVKTVPDKFYAVGMYSRHGDVAVNALIKLALKLPISTSDSSLYAFLKLHMDRIAVNHPEVWDTAVREAIIGALEDRTHRDLTIYF